MSNAEKLRAMRDYIEEHGWTRNRLQNDAGEVCLLGAKNAVVWGSPYIAAERVVSNDETNKETWARNDSLVLSLVQCLNPDITITDILIARETYANFVDVAEWNDHVAESKEQVIEMLDKCADRVEGEDQ